MTGTQATWPNQAHFYLLAFSLRSKFVEILIAGALLDWERRCNFLLPLFDKFP
jgi:hypothetical protein